MPTMPLSKPSLLSTLMCFHTVLLAEKRLSKTAQTTLHCNSDSSYLKVFISHVSCLPVSRSSLPVPYWLMCSGCVLERRSMAASMAAIPPSFLMLSVEKLVCAPAPEHQSTTLQTVNDCLILVFTLSGWHVRQLILIHNHKTRRPLMG